MLPERVDKMRQEYTGQQVTVDDRREELVRFAGTLGRVKTINFNGRALVQFGDRDTSWHDIDMDDLKVVDTPEPEATEIDSTPAEMPQSAAPAKQVEKLSRLELARLEKEGKT